MSKLFTKAILLFFLSVNIIACSKDDDVDYSLQSKFDIFEVQADNTTVVMNGEIKSRTLDDFKHLMEGHPNITLIRMLEVPGSSDDETNLQVSKLINERGINTHIENKGMIASGGVDFFLAGVKRTKDELAAIGVHSWSDGSGKQATDFPNDSPEHQAYIQYYQDMGFSKEWSEEFYFFTIKAAPADDIHWMTKEEIEKFGMFTD
ncbi:alpha/beta hydrolase [Marinifilum caeruleilacunae]|uniref:Alpha/beta hydrolase n=1 Tax=Marinifilum caeruleilacunae TaxID=2499076 RepID=A0ABX1X298_9BACT|nr:alpha/beta hydrolase [Marinifilum caeruleilacunae]NOU62251.1 alpha/beta hydrolase [Marinifilum caeruleilacunae]